MGALRFDTQLATRLVKQYEAGASQRALAERYATDQGTIRKALRKAGARPRRAGGPTRRITASEERAIARWYVAGNSQAKIATRLGTSQTKISQALGRLGLRTGKNHRDGTQHPLWNGGRICVNGYVYVRADLGDALARAMAQQSGYVAEHRLVVARELGRALATSETVHHINGDRQDNRPANLQLRQGKHGKGTVHRCSDCGSHNIVAVPIGGGLDGP